MSDTVAAPLIVAGLFLFGVAGWVVRGACDRRRAAERRRRAERVAGLRTTGLVPRKPSRCG